MPSSSAASSTLIVNLGSCISPMALTSAAASPRAPGPATLLQSTRLAPTHFPRPKRQGDSRFTKADQVDREGGTVAATSRDEPPHPTGGVTVGCPEGGTCKCVSAGWVVLERVGASEDVSGSQVA